MIVAVLAITAYLYRLTAESHTAALGLIAGLVVLLAFGDALATVLAGRISRFLTSDPPGPPAPEPDRPE
jgi:hypothetical protein